MVPVEDDNIFRFILILGFVVVFPIALYHRLKAHLPAGVELEFRAWQEKTKFVQNVTVNGEATKWGKGRFRLTLDPADQSQNEIKVQVSL